jgi:hypothetical protein
MAQDPYLRGEEKMKNKLTPPVFKTWREVAAKPWRREY